MKDDDDEMTDVSGALNLRDEVLGSPGEVGGSNAVQNGASNDSPDLGEELSYWSRILALGESKVGARFAIWERLGVLAYFSVLALAGFTTVELAVNIAGIRSGPLWTLMRGVHQVRVQAFELLGGFGATLIHNELLLLVLTVLVGLLVARSLRRSL